MQKKSESNSLLTQQTVVVCGSLHLDVVVDAPKLPRIDETVVGSEVNYVCGGKGGNQAVAAALNGAKTDFIGCLGNDEFGNKLSAHLQQYNIDCSGLQSIEGASGMSVAIVDKNGDYGAVIVSASNLSIDGNKAELPTSAGILLLQNEVPDAVNIALAQQAKALSVPVMLNAAPYRTLPTELLSLIDILVLNRVEAGQFFNRDIENTDDVIQALQDSDSGINSLIVTLGDQGLVYRDSADKVQAKSARAVTVSSSHGAGDMFCGALASRIINGSVTSEALDYAMDTAAWYVSATLEERLNMAIGNNHDRHFQ